MKTILFSLGVASLLFVSCATNKTSTVGSKSVGFEQVKNYFSLSNEKQPVLTKITSRAEFEKLFGPAAFMGKDGEPTKVDFKKYFLVAYILPETNRKTDISAQGFAAKDGKTLVVKYKLEEGGEQSYTTKPFFLVLVDRKYADYDLALERL